MTDLERLLKEQETEDQKVHSLQKYLSFYVSSVPFSAFKLDSIIEWARYLQLFFVNLY